MALQLAGICVPISTTDGGQGSDNTIFIDDSDQNDDTNNQVDATHKVNENDEDHSDVALSPTAMMV
jgi:hypothetical protein